jgi:hypothetical protein
MPYALRVLIVEDSAEDAELLVCELQRGGYEAVCERVETTGIRSGHSVHHWSESADCWKGCAIVTSDAAVGACSTKVNGIAQTLLPTNPRWRRIQVGKRSSR